MKQLNIYFIFLILLNSCGKEKDSPEPTKETLPSTEDVCTKMDDINFMKYCYNRFDANKDGKVSMVEASSVSSIIIDNNTLALINSSSVSSFKGIEYFYNITELLSNNNKISSFPELKSLKKLKKLTLNRINDINELDLSANSDLETFDCAYSNISNININNLLKLTNINVGSNKKIKSLDISKTPNIKSIYAVSSSLEEVILKRAQDNVIIRSDVYRPELVLVKKTYID